MDDKFFWDVFKNTGSVESYLTYKTISEFNTQNTQNQNTPTNNGEKK